MNGMCDETCKGSAYVRVMAGEIGFGNRRTQQTAWCDFIGVNRHSRPCPAGKGCTEKKTAVRKRRKRRCQ